MIKHALMLAAAVLVAGCTSGPSQTTDNAVGGPNVVSTTGTPLAKGATSLPLDWGSKGQAGQVAIADVLTYGGNGTKITAPTGWQSIRDDSTTTTRQSLYWHAIQANEPSTATWTFSEPVDAQGAVVLLDNATPGGPVDMTTGNSGNGGTVTAKSVATVADGDLIIAFFASDFSSPGLGPTLPPNVNTLTNQESTRGEYWIVANYQSQNGNTDDLVSTSGQSFNWVAAQVAIKRAAAPSSAP